MSPGRKPWYILKLVHFSNSTLPEEPPSSSLLLLFLLVVVVVVVVVVFETPTLPNLHNLPARVPVTHGIG
jgi:hypothetical protein